MGSGGKTTGGSRSQIRQAFCRHSTERQRGKISSRKQRKTYHTQRFLGCLTISGTVSKCLVDHLPPLITRKGSREMSLGQGNCEGNSVIFHLPQGLFSSRHQMLNFYFSL